MKKLIPQHIRDLQPYQSSRLIGLNGHTYLNANESPWNNSVVNCTHHDLNRYPEFQPYKLLCRYSKYSNLSINQILITRGADEGIDLITRAFCSRKNADKIMFFPPTYDMYFVVSEIYNLKNKSIPLLSNFQLDVLTIKKNVQDVKLIYICNPNNPTGNAFLRKDIINILDAVSDATLIVIDEAYIEYSMNNSFIFALKKYTNLVILRTLSKAFGLASLRCGFILSNTKIIDILKKVLAPYPIPTPTSDIAVKALHSSNIRIVKNNILKISENKELLIQKLRSFSCIKKIFSSETNFLLIRFIHFEVVFKYFISKGIILRDQSHKLGLENCLRVSIGTIDECHDLINVLSDFEGKKKIHEKKNFIY